MTILSPLVYIASYACETFISYCRLN